MQAVQPTQALGPSQLIGRVLDADGAPVGDTELLIDVRAKQRRRLTCRTGPDGFFRFELRRFIPIDYAQSILMTETARREEGSPTPQVLISGPLQLLSGEIDLGSLRLEPQAIAASGRVVDREGHGVADARVWISELMPRDESKPAQATRRLDTWIRTKSGPGGWFTARIKEPDSIPTPGALVATATRGELSTLMPVPLKLGDNEVELRLGLGSGIQVDTRLIEPGYIRPQSLQFYNLDVSARSGRFGAGKVHTARPLRPGRYRLAAELDRGIDSPLVAIGDEIHLASGEVHVDPLLNPVIIEDYVRRYQFDVVLPDGSRPKWIELGRDWKGRVWGEPLMRKKEGFTVTTIIGAEEPRYWVHVPGTRRINLNPLPDGETIHLVKGIDVTLKLTGSAGTDPYDEKRSRGYVHLLAESYRQHYHYPEFGLPVSFNASGEGKFSAPCPGEFEISFYGNGGGKRTGHFAPWHKSTFHVSEESGTVGVAPSD